MENVFKSIARKKSRGNCLFQLNKIFLALFSLQTFDCLSTDKKLTFEEKYLSNVILMLKKGLQRCWY